MTSPKRSGSHVNQGPTTAHQKTVLGGASVEERAASSHLPALLVRSGEVPRGAEGGGGGPTYTHIGGRGEGEEVREGLTLT